MAETEISDEGEVRVSFMMPARLHYEIQMFAESYHTSFDDIACRMLSSWRKELRDTFASAALTGILANPNAAAFRIDAEADAKWCFEVADAMNSQRMKR